MPPKSRFAALVDDSDDASSDEDEEVAEEVEAAQEDYVEEPAPVEEAKKGGKNAKKKGGKEDKAADAKTNEAPAAAEVARVPVAAEVRQPKKKEEKPKGPKAKVPAGNKFAALLGDDSSEEEDSEEDEQHDSQSANNEATWCDIFPNVPPDVYKAKVVDIFKRMAFDLCGDVPLKVINDGEVTALAAVQKIKQGNVLGISMGSSEGGGYANADGNLMGWINEMCYIRLDLNPEAPTDPWSKGAHRGLSHMYLGQRGATKLAAKAGVDVPANYVYPHPDMCNIKHEDHAQCLKLIQKAMADPAQEPKVRMLYETVGVYLGYALAQYCEFYKIDHVMILGRVSKGAGGDLVLETAKKVLNLEFPEYASMQFHTADDHFKAVGQCIAAAALPSLP